jgi:hypothetical protein
MTRKERARIARENGAKSKGPITEEGRAKSAQNANKSEEYAQKIALFLPPQGTVLCNEDRQAFQQLCRELVEIYQPANQLAHSVVLQIANARWQVDRLNLCLTAQWNLAVVDSANAPGTVTPELAELEIMARSIRALYTGGAVAHRINRQIDQLELRIARLERRIKFVHANFPTAAKPPAPQKEEKEDKQPSEPAEQKTQINEPTVYVTETNPEVIKAYKQQFPHCKIVVLPPDDVAKGIDTEDDMPVAPRKAG